MGNRIYGCDDCLAVCPWNKFAKDAQETAYHARESLQAPHLEDLLTLDDSAFRSLFSGSPIKRTGRDRFIRNVLIATGNSGNIAYIEPITALLNDASPLVRAMAVWALSQLLPPDDFFHLRKGSLADENDVYVIGEWMREKIDGKYHHI
jgi:epoxyqueuosine reductase